MAAVHRTYALALFQAAGEADRLAQVHEQLGEFARAVTEVPALRAVLRNPQVDARAKGELVAELADGADELLRNLLRLLAAKGRIGEIEEVEREFERLVALEERRLDVQLTTAYELSDEEAREIVGQIEQASGRKVDATRKVDTTLIGGVVLQAGTMRLDASVRGRLNRLRRELVSHR